jgi:bacillolysin
MQKVLLIPSHPASRGISYGFYLIVNLSLEEKWVMNRRLSILVFSALCLSATLPVDAQASAVRETLDRMEEAAGGRIEVTLSPETGLVTFLTVDARSPVPVVGARATSPEAIAMAFLQEYAGAFGFRSAENDVELSGPSWRDEVGQDHVRFRQIVRGVPVTAGEVSVHLRGSDVLAVNAEILPDLDLVDVEPTFFANQALDVAWKLVASPRIGFPNAELSAPRLEILNRGLLEQGHFPTRLAWFIEARAFGLWEYIWIDAKSGVTLLHFSQLTEARNRLIYDGNNSSALPGTLVRVEGGPVTGNADANAAYTYSGDTYSYFLAQHGRDSYDGAGAPLISTVKYCPSPAECPLANAFWTGSQMIYGQGFSMADDVDAHELTHAVTQYTANLFYYMQSGALNESFSDMFGETVDLTNAGGTDTLAVRWKMGEDVPGIGALRDMMTPGNFGDPGRVGDPIYYCGYDDEGGVHINSGVPNHLYALMVDGGTYNGQTVTGMGLTKAGKIAYRALTVYLLSGSSFTDAANAFKRSCSDLVGTAGIKTNDCQEVTDALAAVQMTQAPPCASGAAGQYPALCPAGQRPINIFLDTFESGLDNTNWLVQWTVQHAWFPNNAPYSSSGIWHAFGSCFDFTNDSWLYMANSVAIPSNARMQFNHSWDFEPPNWDGGVVEYSLNGGTTWADALALYSVGSNYSGTIASGSGNPIGGRAAYVNTSRGYTGTQLSLASLAGQSNVKLRFRIGTDSSEGRWGWDVDDVRIYTCAACTYSLAVTRAFVGAGGGSGTAAVTTQNHCTWTASSSAAWLKVNPGMPGSGKAGYTADPNTTGVPRSATLTLGGQTFTVFQGAQTDYFTVTPCRVFDTRTTTPMISGTTRVFTITGGSCGIPSTAKAVSVNLTAVSPTGLGSITLFPDGLSLPNTSSISFVTGKNQANNAVLVLAPDGTGTIKGVATVTGGGNVHLLLDVSGYFQ